jgi:hypothetical protein
MRRTLHFHLILAVAWMPVMLSGSTAGTSAPAVQLTTRVISQDVLESITHLDCAFAAGVSGTWAAARPTAIIRQRTDLLLLDISDIHVVDGSATTNDRGRIASVSVRSDRSNLYFLEIGSGDAVLATTVFSQETAAGRLKAVHTRSGRNPAQFYGDCRVVR